MSIVREVCLSQRVLEETLVGFSSLALSPLMLRAIQRAGFVTPSPIQAEFIPEALDGLDVIGQAKTGTGKTAAFAIPLIEMLEPSQGIPQAIVLAPTRELVQQIVEEFVKLSDGRSISIRGVYGGEPIQKQLASLATGVDIVVGTPGRVLDHIERRTLRLDGIFHVVLDEADRMLDIGFRPDIERILRRIPDPHQTLLLSATINAEVRRLAQKYMFEPSEVNLSRDELSVETIQQFHVTVDHDRKIDLLLHLLKRDQPRQCIVFTRTKRGADRLAARLRGKVPGVATIHGDLAQAVRNRVMKSFREGSINVLVATDVVGRGIDVNDISHVINFDIPEDPENYLHRIGRTGRMGKDGVAFLFVCPDQGELLTTIEMLINKEIPALPLHDFEAVRKASAPSQRTSTEFRELFRMV